jgi:uncharacterized membrane protein
METDSSLNLPPAASSDATPNAKSWHFSWPHIVLAFVGLFFSYQAWQAHLAVARGEESTCGVTQTINCDKVLSSQYAEIFGIPVGVLGMVYFAVVLLTAISNEANFSWPRFRLVQLLVSCAGIASSIGFTYISRVILQTLCLICLRVHSTTTALFVVSLVLWLMARKRARAAE